MADAVLPNPEADALLSKFSGAFENQADAFEALNDLLAAYTKLNTSNAAIQSKAVTEANRVYATQLKARAAAAKNMTEYIARLNSTDAAVKRAALQAIASESKTMITTMTEIEEKESLETHPWYATARAKATTAAGGVKGAAFWNELITTVTQGGIITREDFNMRWLVQNLETKMSQQEIGDWRNMQDISEETRQQLNEMWTAAKTATQSLANTKAEANRVMNSVVGSAANLASWSDEQVAAAAQQLMPIVAQLNKQLVGDKDPTTLQTEAKALTDIESQAQSKEIQLALGDMLLEFMSRAGVKGSSSGGFPPFSVEKNAQWKGYIVADEKFRTWAKENGYESIGTPRFNDKGEIVGIIPGADDTKAIRRYGNAVLHAGDPEYSGYGETPIKIMDEESPVGIRSGIAMDAEGNIVPLIQVSKNGMTEMFQGVKSNTLSGKNAPMYDFIPAKTSDFVDASIKFNTDEPKYYAELQSGDPAMIARKFQNEYNAGVVTKKEEPPVTEEVKPKAPRTQVTYGTIDLNGKKYEATEYVIDGNKTIYWSPSDTQLGVPFEGSTASFTAMSEGGPYVFLSADGDELTSLPELRIIAEDMEGARPEKEYVPVSYNTATKRMAPSKPAEVKPPADGKPAAPEVPALTEITPTEEQKKATGPRLGIDYGVHPLKEGVRRIKQEDGTFIEVAADKVAPLKPEEAKVPWIDKMQIGKAQREARRAEAFPNRPEVGRVENLDKPFTTPPDTKGAAFDAAGKPEEGKEVTFGDKPPPKPPSAVTLNNAEKAQLKEVMDSLFKIIQTGKNENDEEVTPTQQKNAMSIYEKMIPIAEREGVTFSPAPAPVATPIVAQAVKNNQIDADFAHADVFDRVTKDAEGKYTVLTEEQRKTASDVIAQIANKPGGPGAPKEKTPSSAPTEEKPVTKSVTPTVPGTSGAPIVARKEPPELLTEDRRKAQTAAMEELGGYDKKHKPQASEKVDSGRPASRVGGENKPKISQVIPGEMEGTYVAPAQPVTPAAPVAEPKKGPLATVRDMLKTRVRTGRKPSTTPVTTPATDSTSK